MNRSSPSTRHSSSVLPVSRSPLVLRGVMGSNRNRALQYLRAWGQRNRNYTSNVLGRKDAARDQQRMGVGWECTGTAEQST